MKKLKQLLFPLWASKDIELSEQAMKDIQGFDETFDLSEDDYISMVYHCKTGRSLIVDQLVSGFCLAGLLILSFIIISIIIS